MALKKYKVLRPVGISGRLEIGTVVPLDEEYAAAYAPGYLELVGEVEEAAPVEKQPDVQPQGEGNQIDSGAGNESGATGSVSGSDAGQGSGASTEGQNSQDAGSQAQSTDASGSQSSDQSTGTDSGAGNESGQQAAA